MAFKTGNSGNPEGRPKGAQNKVTTDLRQWINNFLDSNLEQIQKDWKSLDAKDRIILFEKLLKYSVPTLQSTNVTAEIYSDKSYHEFKKIQSMNKEELIKRRAQLKKVVEK